MKQQEIFELFVGNDDLREWMKVPFVYASHVYATDAYTLIRTLDVNMEFKAEKCASNVDMSSIIPKNAVSLDLDLKNLDLNQYKTEDEWTDDDEECDGSGEVDWEYDGVTKTHYKEDDCPVCKGKGYLENSKKTGNKTFGNQQIKFVCGKKSVDIKVKYIERLQLLQKELDCKIEVLNCSDNKLFCSLDKYEVLIMGVNNYDLNNVEDIVLTIEL
jgi:hypothetical protein